MNRDKLLIEKYREQNKLLQEQLNKCEDEKNLRETELLYNEEKPVPMVEQVHITQKIPDQSHIQCHHKFTRDFDTDPIKLYNPRISHHGVERRVKCKVPCERAFSRQEKIDAIIMDRNKNCEHQKTVYATMENEGMPHGFDIYANTKLDSDVPLQYFSWELYSFEKPIVWPKTASAMAVAFISNCGGTNNRLRVMRELMERGVTVHSYGRCETNAEIPEHLRNKGQWEQKIEILKNYKFTLAFENSNAKDYVTEKFFQTIGSGGSLPIYLGAPNIDEFAPSPHSIIKVSDFKSIKDLADYIKYLDKNDTAYLEYWNWKKTGYSKDFIAMMDLSLYHSDCRICLKVVDMYRYEGLLLLKHYLHDVDTYVPQKGPGIELMVRERHDYKFVRFKLRVKTMKALKKAIHRVFEKNKLEREGPFLHSIYKISNRKKIQIKEDNVKDLKNGDELEVIWIKLKK